MQRLLTSAPMFRIQECSIGLVFGEIADVEGVRARIALDKFSLQGLGFNGVWLEGLSVATFKRVSEEVPGVRPHKVRHSKRVHRLVAVKEELQGHRGEKARRNVSQIGDLREAHDRYVRACLVDTRVAQVVGVGDPFNLRNDALHVCRLVPFLSDLVGGLAERAVSFLGEEPWHIFPLVLHRLVILEDRGPQLAHLLLLGLGHIGVAPEIAMITWLLCALFAVHLLGSVISGEQTKAGVGKAILVNQAELLASPCLLGSDCHDGN